MLKPESQAIAWTAVLALPILTPCTIQTAMVNDCQFWCWDTKEYSSNFAVTLIWLQSIGVSVLLTINHSIDSNPKQYYSSHVYSLKRPYQLQFNKQECNSIVDLHIKYVKIRFFSSKAESDSLICLAKGVYMVPHIVRVLHILCLKWKFVTVCHRYTIAVDWTQSSILWNRPVLGCLASVISFSAEI